MKKFFIVFSSCILLCACSKSEENNSFVCRSEYEKSTKEAIYYYEDEKIESVLIKMSQVLSDEVIATRNKDEILSDLKDAFLATVGTETQIEVAFNEKTKRADVEMLMYIEKMNERELRYLNLYETQDAKKVMKLLKTLGSKCKKVDK